MTAETSAFSVFVETPAEMQQLYNVIWQTVPEPWSRSSKRSVSGGDKTRRADNEVGRG